MVEGLPGSDFAGVKTHWRKARVADIKAWGRLRCRVVPGPLARIAEKCDLTRGFVLFSDYMCCNCVPAHVICGFWYTKLAAYLTRNNVALWVFG